MEHRAEMLQKHIDQILYNQWQELKNAAFARKQ